MNTAARIIAAIVEAPTTYRMRKASAAHAQRKAERIARERAGREERAAQRSMRDRTEYPFHA